MPTRKQRRRRQKDRRHGYEFVYVDEEGEQVEVDEDERPARRQNGKRESKQPQKRRAASGAVREVKPPSWNRAIKRGALFAPFLYLFLTALEHVDPLPAVGVALLYSAVFIPMFFFVDRMAYRAYRRKVGAG